MMQDVRQEFPYFKGPRAVHYLDSAAATLMPQPVLDRLRQFYAHEMANVHRASHSLGNQATEMYEKARQTVAHYIGAPQPEEVVFTRSTTEAINLVAQSWGRQNLTSQDKILLTEMEHHSNLVPWQQVAQQTGAQLQYVSVTESGELDLQDLQSQLPGVKILALTACSNVLGTVNPIEKICTLAHQQGAVVLVDAAQSMAFQKIDVQGWGCDFLAFSGHKMFGPFGAGVLWGRHEHLLDMPVYQTGGAMIEKVNWQQSQFLPPPQKFEAGTPHIAGPIALAKAIHWLQNLGLEQVAQHDIQLAQQARKQLQELHNPKLRFLGPAEQQGPLFSFVLEDLNAFDVAQIVDQCGVAVRAGHHCCEPLLKKLGFSSVLRASFSVYNNEQDIQALCQALQEAHKMLKVG